MKRLFLALIFINLFFLPISSHVLASEVRHFDSLGHFPILDNGRLKPLDTYARNTLIQFSGKDTFENKEAMAWLCAVLFSPEKTKLDKVFLINNPDIATALGIEPSVHRRYSLKQFEKSMPKLIELADAADKIAQVERSVVDHEILRVFENIKLYVGLTHAFAFTFADKDFALHQPAARQALRLPGNGPEFSFTDIALRAGSIYAVIKAIEQKPRNEWLPHEVEIMELLGNLYSWSSTFTDEHMLIIPAVHEIPWISAWDAVKNDFKNERTRQLIEKINTMGKAYKNGSQVEFDLAAQGFLALTDSKKLKHFDLELAYHKYRPFLYAKIFYILALVFFVGSFFFNQKFWYGLSWGFIGAGFILHLSALIARIVIMGRPPVTNLYETFIFVALIGVLLGILIEYFNRKWLGIIVAGISGTVLLFIASKYSAEGDTLKMLVAVLNSNFWLGTHVTTITIGYGATCVAGILGHIWLIQAVFKKSQDVLNNTFSVMVGMLGLALTLTFIGTNLGGIWADQSWGRFWGWDPKENGALMIVLWCAILFHARIAKMIGSVGMAVGTVLGMIVVMWAWFGVNLLSIGLHSYGFTSGIANTLLIYVICELIFIGVTLFCIKRRRSI